MLDSLRGRTLLRYLWLEQRGLCPVCTQKITLLTGWRTHYLIPRTKGGLTRQPTAFSFIPTATTGFTVSISPCLNRVSYPAFERLELCELETLKHSS